MNYINSTNCWLDSTPDNVLINYDIAVEKEWKRSTVLYRRRATINIELF